MLRLRGGGANVMQVAHSAGQKKLGLGGKSQESEGPTVGPTVRSKDDGDAGGSLTLPSSYMPFAVSEGPLAEAMRLVAVQERALLLQASRCRVAMTRMDFLQKIMAARPLQVFHRSQSERLCSMCALHSWFCGVGVGVGGVPWVLMSSNAVVQVSEQKEVERWKVSSVTMQKQLKQYMGNAGKELAEMLGEKPLGTLSSEDLQDMSAVTPDHHSEDDDTVSTAKRRKAVLDGPSVRKPDGSLGAKAASPDPMDLAMEDETALMGQTGIGKQPTQGPYAPTTWSGAASLKQRPSISPPKQIGKAIFAQPLEDKYRVATYEGIPVYGAVKSPDGKKFSYLADTELHLVWDIDQSKLVGEGTNDVELVIKCVLWWKEEMSHDPHFVPSAVPDDVRKEFQEYCDAFDIEKALDVVMPLLVRPGAKQFVEKHSHARWWTFTNKDREVDGQVVRDVSDDDGQVGMFQTHPHEISGRPVVDANKYALQVLDRTACKHLGIQNQERPLIGVRGQRKDMSRVAKLIKKKRERDGAPLDTPVSICLIDDRKCDAWGNCQANDERFLCHIPAYTAVSESMAADLVSAMESILPAETLSKFYCAFRDADATHALIQCVDIMSDDQSMLLKKTELTAAKGKEVQFAYKPKKIAESQLPPALPAFDGTTE